MKILYIFFGMIASGKSTLAKAFAAKYDLSYYNTDLVRKKLAGVSATTPCRDDWGKGIYSPEFTEKTYDTMLDLACADLCASHNGVVLDGSYLNPAERTKVKDRTKRPDITFVFVYCHCEDQVVKKRLAIRAADSSTVSDGRWEIYLIQKKQFVRPDDLQANECITLETNRPVQELLQSLAKSLKNRLPAPKR